MKKLAFLNIFIVALLFTSCDPNELIYDELDLQEANLDEYYEYNIGKESAPESYTLTDEDYELSSDEGVADYKNFSEYTLPKDFLPEILNIKFFAPDAYAMKVTYNFYAKPVVDESNAKEISEAEYSSMGQSYPNFSDKDAAEALIAKLLDRSTYDNEAGDEKTVLYTLYAKSETRYIRVNADLSAEILDYSSDAYELTDADYGFLGYGNYNNFSYIDQAEESMPNLAIELGHDLPQDYKCVVYTSYSDIYIVYIFDGSEWAAKQSVMPVTEVLNYSLNLDDVTTSTWWADPAIKIALGSADYEVYPDACSYYNFDLRTGKNPGTDAAILVEMVGAMLDANHSPVDDQQYLVTYAYYDGSNGTADIRVLRTAGVWSEYSN